MISEIVVLKQVIPLKFSSNQPTIWNLNGLNSDDGPGFFDIPEDMLAEISIRNLHDDSIKGLIEEIQDVDGLFSFNLSENRNVGNKGMRFIPLLTQISHLNLSACGLNDYGIDPIIQMRNIRYLDLSYCTRLTDLSIKKLADMRRLEELIPAGNS